MRDRIEAVVRDKRFGWPTFVAGVVWEVADIAGNAAFLRDVFVKVGFWEMLKRAISLPPLLVMIVGAAWFITAWRLAKPSAKPTKPALVPRTDEDIAKLVDTFAGRGEDVVIRIEREESTIKTSFTVVKRTR